MASFGLSMSHFVLLCRSAVSVLNASQEVQSRTVAKFNPVSSKLASAVSQHRTQDQHHLNDSHWSTFQPQ